MCRHVLVSVLVLHWFPSSRCGLQVFELRCPLSSLQWQQPVQGGCLAPRVCFHSAQVVVLMALERCKSPGPGMFLSLLLRHHRVCSDGSAW